MAFDGRAELPPLDLPDMDGIALRGPCGQVLAIGREGYAGHGRRRLERVDLLPGFCIPEQHTVVRSGGGAAAAVGTIGDAGNLRCFGPLVWPFGHTYHVCLDTVL